MIKLITEEAFIPDLSQDIIPRQLEPKILIMKNRLDKGYQPNKYKGEIIMDNEEMRFTVVNDKGKEIECEVLFTFESEETGKSYIVYTDDTLGEDGSTKVYASIFDPESENEESKLIPIETNEEWTIIETILEQLQEEALEDDEED